MRVTSRCTALTEDDRIRLLVDSDGADRTVFDDDVRDSLRGGVFSRDWFFADIDGLHGDDDKLQGEEDDIVIDLGELLLTI